MKPIRSNELEFMVKLIDTKFQHKGEVVDTEISVQASKLAEKQKPKFAKMLGIEALLKKVVIASAKYHDFVQSKTITEDKLSRECTDVAEQLSKKLGQYSTARKWNTNFDSFETKDDTSNYFTNKLDEVCYEEAKKSIQKNHAIYNNLKEIKDNCRLVIHTGADINNTVKALQKEMGKADIKLPIPEQLLQIAVN